MAHRFIFIPRARSAADITVARGLVWQKSFTVLAEGPLHY
jgi:hypothetical protein